MVDLYLDRFRRWLESRDPNSVVGYANDCTSCPVATWISRDLGIREPIVDKQRITFFDHFGEYQLVDTPGWATRFIELIDGDLDACNEDVRVYRDEAIEALNVVEGVA